MTTRYPSSGNATSRLLTTLLAALIANSFLVTPVSAHGSSHAPDIPQEAGLLTLALGLSIITAGIYYARRRPDTHSKSPALFVLGLATSVLGSILLVELSTVDTLTASQLPFVRSWYAPLSAILGSATAIGSLVLVRSCWPRRGRRSSEATAAPSAVAVTGPNACCCCGPVLAELAVVTLGSSLVAPLYWVFVDIASPVGAIFFTASVLLLTATLIRFEPGLTAGPCGGEVNA